MNRNPWLDPPWSARRSGDEATRPGDWRSWYHRDRARIIHSSAFRRLQTKTQVLGMGGSEFHRTRLTHSLETAQIARGIAGQLAAQPDLDAGLRALLPPGALIEAVALAHDLGHPPFGHGGETALNRCMAEHGGFEGNAQTLRLIARLEAGAGEFGLDLARRTMVGVLKYPVPQSALRAAGPRQTPTPWQTASETARPLKGIYDVDVPLVDWLLAPFAASDHTSLLAPPGRKTFDTLILELADDIAYGVHDMEDAIALSMLHKDDVMPVWRMHAASLAGLPSAPDARDVAALFGDESARKQAVGLLVNFFVVSIAVSQDASMQSPPLAWQISLPAAASAFLADLIALVRHHVIETPLVQALEFRGQEIVRRLFETLASDPPRFLPPKWRSLWRQGNESPRFICDYVACMTDEQATRIYELFFYTRGAHPAAAL